MTAASGSMTRRALGGVRQLSLELLDSVVGLLSSPITAAALGLGSGAGLFALSHASFRAVTPADPERGLAIMAISLLGRLVAATASLFLYQRFAPAGFMAFGLSLAGVFFVLYTVELVRYAGLHRYARPAAGSRDGR